MNTIFITGKGGVGKSTIAAALARQLSERGTPVLAVSLDPAHNLGDIFDVSLSHRRRRIDETLDLLELDLERAAREQLAESTSLLQQTYGYLRAINMDMTLGALKYSPGLEEHAGMMAIERMIRTEDRAETIVFDTPPTGLTLRILALPKVSLAWIGRLIAIRKGILDRRYTLRQYAGQGAIVDKRLAFSEDEDPVMGKLKELRGRYTELTRMLEGPDNTVAVVFNPDELSLRESGRLADGLADLGLPLRVAIDNKVAEDNRDVADRVEAEFLKGRAALSVQRVPWEGGHAGPGSLLSADIASAFSRP